LEKDYDVIIFLADSVRKDTDACVDPQFLRSEIHKPEFEINSVLIMKLFGLLSLAIAEEVTRYDGDKVQRWKLSKN